MKERSYRESVDLVLSEILTASSNVRSVSMIAPSGKLLRYKIREDVNLLLNTNEMTELIKNANQASLLFYKFAPKLGELRHMYLDFENLHALIFPMPDHNVLLVTLEKAEPDLPRMASFITRLLQREGMIHAS
ncbi:MAG TPA: hypothetical protein VD736_01975 [Nitrososphaera sp.]|nr:hypothetical protein [Nitrososphaera sp.]